MRTGGKQWEGTWTGGLCVKSASERVDVRRLKQDERARVWQTESSVNGGEQVVQGTTSRSEELT